jgi:hypothetical protein
MSPEPITLHQAIAEERRRLLDRLWQDIIALRQLVQESQQLVEDTRREPHSRALGMSVAPAKQN